MEAFEAAEEAAQTLRAEVQRVLLNTKEGERCVSLMKENRRLYRVMSRCPKDFDPLLDFLEEDYDWLEKGFNTLLRELDTSAPANARNLRAKAAAI